MGYVRQTTEIECSGYGEDVTVKPKEERKKNIEPRNKNLIPYFIDCKPIYIRFKNKKRRKVKTILHQNKNFKEVIIFYL